MVQVSLSATSNFEDDPNLLVESDGTIANISFSLDESPPTLGTTVTVGSPDLAEFDVTQIQIDGGELGLPDTIQSQLTTVLNSKLTETVPGATIAVTLPLGNWSGTAGVANLAAATPVETGDRFEIGSITKVFTATTLLKLVEAGTLSLDDTLTDWLPESVTTHVTNAEDITLRQLLNHTSGVAEYDFILLEQGMSNPFVFLQDWQPEEIVELISDSGPVFAPGEGWQYANTNFILAGMVIEAATGNDLATVTRTNVIDPLGLDNTFFASQEDIPDGYISGYLDFDQDGTLDDVSIANLSWAWAAGAIVSNTDDLTDLTQALYAGDFLDDATKAEMFTLVDTGRGYEYGLGMMSFDTPDLGRIVGHRGGSLGFNANMWYSAEDDFTYVELLNGRTEEALVTDTIPAFRSSPLADIGNTPAYDEFNVTLTEATAAVSLPVVDDGVVEDPETVTFTVQPGADYTVNPNAQTSTLTLIDSEEDISMSLPDRVITALDEALDNNLPPEVPGAAVAILTNEGEWFGATGFADLENQVSLQPDDRFEAGSITKTFVATTLLQLVEENQLTLNDTLTDWLAPEVTDLIPNASDITIEQMLNHTSGVADYLDILTAQAASNPLLFLQDWQSEQLLGFLNGVEPFFAPGTSWQYSNTNYILAGLVIEAVTGNGYGQEIRDRILDPLELDNTFVFGEEEIPGGYINSYWDFNGDGALDNLNIVNLSWTGSAGSIISNTEDLADFFDGLLVDDALLQPETLAQMLDTIPVNSPNYDSYGLGIGTLESPNRFWYAHRGQTLGFRSNLWYSPLEEITYVELLNGRSSSNLVSDLLPTYRRTIQPPTPDIVTYEFEWTGQIAEFSVEGEFSFDLSQSYPDGIVREENLESFDIAFFDPDGNLLRTYEDNHLTFPEFNFAFDTNTQELLQDGFFLGPEGFNFGEKTPVGEGFSGLNFWSRPEFNSQGEVPPPHVHIDDWADEFGFPIGFSSHEDVAFFTRTTAELIETGRVGATYLDGLQDSLDELGSRVVVSFPENEDGSFEVVDGATSLFLDFSLFEVAGLIIQDATPTADPFSNQFQLGFAIAPTTDFTFDAVPSLTAGGTIEHTGDVTFLVGGDTLLTIGDFSIGFDETRVSDATSGFFVADTLEDGLGIDILFDISVPERFLVTEDSLTIADADLLLAPELAGILGLNDFVGADVGNTRIDAETVKAGPPLPQVSLVIEPSAVSEEEAPFTTEFKFIVEGEIPEGGLPILFGAEGNDLIEILDQLDGAFPQEPIGMESLGFFPSQGVVGLNLLQNEAILTRTIANDVIEESDRTFTFNVVPDTAGLVTIGDGYTVDPETGSDTLTLTDDNGGPGVGPMVGLTVTATELAEGDEFTVNFTVDGDIPEGGLTVLVDGNQDGVLGEFNLFNEDGTPAFTTTGIAGVPELGDDRAGAFLATLIEPDASITLSIFDDGPGEGPETITFDLVNGEVYEVDAVLGSVDLTIQEDSVTPESIVTVEFSSTTFIEELGTPFPGTVESPQTLTVTFTVDGEIDPSAPPVINFASSEPDGLTRFSLTELEAEGLLPEVDIINFEFTDADITLLSQTSSITVPVFNLPDDRDFDGDGIVEDFAGATETVEFTITSLTEGVVINPETAMFTGTFFETVADAGGPNLVGTDAGETIVGDAADDTIDALGGDDTVAGDLGDDVIQGGDGDDVLRGDRNQRNPQDEVAGGDDIIFGGEGSDRIGGKSGNDILSGDAGDDFIWGDDGDDILMGVTGNDTLTGDNGSSGSGSDTFVFGNGDGTDTITDFEVGTDFIGLVESELVFADLTLTQEGANTLLGVADSGEVLAVLNSVQASALDESSFVIVPDVSNPQEALAIV